MRRRSLFSRAILAAWVLAAAFAPAACAAAPEYRNYCLKTLVGWLTDGAFTNPGRLLARGNYHPVAEAAACQVRAWEWTGEERYARGAIGLLTELVASRARVQEDFFVVYPLMYSYRKLDAKNRLDAALKEGFRRFATANFAARDVALHNQTLQRAAGLALAAQTFGDDSLAESWRTYAETIWGLLLAGGDIPEDAPNYNQIDLLYVFLLGDALGTLEQLHDPAIVALYSRYRDQVSPGGGVPAYGDSGNGTQQADWPLRHGWAAWPAAFERAAAFFRDPTFRWAALKVFETGVAREPFAEPDTQAGDLFRLSFADQGLAANMAPREPGPLMSAVLMRPGPGKGLDFPMDETIIDKLILAPFERDDGPFVLCDLLARGFHAHVNQPGAIDYFEFAGAPLLFILGYNNRNPEHSNLVMVGEAGASFPHADPLFDADRWYEAVLPAARLAEVPGKPDERHLSEFSLRVGAGRRGVTLWFEGMRLEGRAGSRAIEPAAEVAGWSRPPTLDAGRRDGSRPLRWELKPGVTVLTRRGLDVRFDRHEYNTIRFFWKLSNNDEQARPLIFRVPGAVDQHCHARQLAPELSGFTGGSLNAPDDRYGAVVYGGGWFSEGTSLSRQLVLTREGILIVRDELDPDAALAGRVAGPIWHLAPTAEPERGANWFNAAGGRVELLVWFQPQPGRTFGVQSVDVWQRKGQKTVFARETLQANQPIRFVTVLVPHGPGVTARSLAGSVAVVENEEGTTVVRAVGPTGQGKVVVTVGRRDLLRVERTP
jgi:hypothetical protein